MWYYQSQEGNAGQNRKPGRLKDLEDHSIKSLIREVIQNSLDVRNDEKKPVILRFFVKELSKSELRQIDSIFGHDCFSFFESAYENAQEDAKIKMVTGYNILKGKNSNLYTLVIEEENCIGLTGSVNGYEREQPKPSNFNSLMRMIDDNEAKKQTTNSGGTWGKGSSVFTFSSSLWMWFAYTQLRDPWTDNKTRVTHKKRFMGRCAIAPFYNLKSETTYLGEGWFCENGKDVYPYVNDAADSIALNLGLNKRDGNFGTTFLIPFFNSFIEDPNTEKIIDEIRSQVLQNWFIPIYKGDLIIEINGKLHNIKINSDYLKSVPQLRFKLEILEWYFQKKPKHKLLNLETFHVSLPKLKNEFKRESNSFAFIKRFTNADLVIRIIEDDEDFETSWNTENKVALTRNRGMIVNHYSPFETNEIRFESILFSGLLTKSEESSEAKSHFDLYLAYAENPSHNKWCHTREDYPICFLERFDGKNPRPETGVYNLFRDIGKILRRFIVKEKQVTTSKDICSIFKKLTRLRSVGDEKSGSSLFLMRKVNEPIIDDQGRIKFIYKLISNTNSDRISISFKSKINSLEGEREKDFDVLGIDSFKEIEILNNDGDLLSKGHSPTINLNPKESSIIQIRTCPIRNIHSFKNIEPLIKATANILQS